MNKKYETSADLDNLICDTDIEYTVQDYLTWQFEELIELIHGKIFRMSPAPSPYHQLITGNLHVEFHAFFKKRNCQVYIAPCDVFLPIVSAKSGKPNTVVEPDLFVVCDPSLIDGRGCQGAPVLVIEVISYHTSKKDIQLKHALYEESGVKEYWVVYPKDQLIQQYALNQHGKYELAGVFTSEDIIIPIQFPDLEISLKEVFVDFV